MVWTREGRVTVKGTTYEEGYPKCGNQSGRRPALDRAKIAAAIASFAPTRIPAYFQLNRFEFASFIRNVLLLDIMRWRKQNAIDWILSSVRWASLLPAWLLHRFQSAMALWRNQRLMTWWPADLHHATVWSQLPPIVHELLVCRLWSGQSSIPGRLSASRHHSLVHGGHQVAFPCSASRHDGEGGTLLADWIPEQLFNWGEVRNCSAENQITNLWARMYGLNGEFISGYFIPMGSVFLFCLNNFRR